MKKPSDPPLKGELCLQLCDHSTICALPYGLGLPPHFTASDPLAEIKLLSADPLAGTSANDPVGVRGNDLFYPSPQLKSPFQVYSDYFATCVLLERP